MIARTNLARGLALAAIALAFAALPAPGQAPVETAQETLRFRRFFVPADHVEEWTPPGDARYVPIERKIFDEWLAIANETPSSSRLPAGTRIPRAEYRARWTEGDSLRGQVSFEIESVARPVLMPLSPFGLAIEKSFWAHAPDSAAVVGARPDGTLCALVERSGSLVVEWTSRGVGDDGDPPRFDLDIPACEQATMLLDLPAAFVPVVRGGMVEAAAAPIESGRRWTIHLGGQTHLECSIRSAASLAAAPLPAFEERASYALGARGLEVEVAWTVDGIVDGPARIEASVARELTLTAAYVGDLPTTWSRVPSTDAADAILLDMPAMAAGRKFAVRIEGRAQFPLGRRWQLPRIAPQGMFWRSGVLRLLAPSPFSLVDVTPFECRQTMVGSIPLVPGEELEFQCFSPEATLELSVDERGTPLNVALGTTIDLGTEAVRGVCRVRLDPPFSEGRELSAVVAGAWTLSDVSSDPPEALGAWHVDPTVPSHHVLSLRLREGQPPDRPIILAIAGRIDQSPLGKTLRPGDLRMLDFDARVVAEGVSVEADGPLRLQWQGVATAVWRKIADLTSEERRLFSPDRTSVVERGPGGSPAWSVSLESLAPRFRGDVQYEATLDADSLQETYRLNCTPQSAPLDRVVVEFSPSRQTPLAWSLAGEPESRLDARRLRSGAPHASEPPPGTPPAPVEVWEVALPKPRRQSFTLVAERRTPFVDRMPFVLASFRDASEQSGEVRLRAPADALIRVENRRLKTLYASTPDNSVPPVRGQFQYDPANEDGQSLAAAAIVARSGPANGLEGAWAWRYSLETRVESSGRNLHLARWYIQSAGRERIRATLPPGASIQAAWIDDRSAPFVHEADGRAVLALPAGSSNVCATIQFATDDEPLQTIDSRTSPAVTIDIPVLASDWTLWLPPEWLASSPHELAMPGATADDSLGQRWLGKLARDPAEPRFDPFSNAAWSDLVDPATHSDRVASWLKELDRYWSHAVNRVESATPGEPPRDWGQFFDAVTERSGLDADSVWMDAPTIAAAGLRVRDRLPRKPDRADDLHLFEGTEWALCIGPTGVLLTTAARASLEPACRPEAANACIFRVYSASEFATLVHGRDAAAPRGAPLYEWLASPEDFPPIATPAGFAASDLRGWSAVRLVLPGERPAIVRIFSHSARYVGAAALLLLTFALGAWRLRQRPGTATLLAGLFAASAGLIDPPLRPIAWATAGGLIASTLVALQRPTPLRRVGRPVLPKAAAVVVAWFLAALAAASGEGAAPPAVENAAVEAHRVYVPVDEAGNPAGDKYFVSEEFYAALRSRRGEALGDPTGWLLLSAEYEGALAQEPQGNRRTLGELRARFDFMVFSLEPKLRLPWNRRELRLNSDQAMIDRAPTRLEWDAAGTAVSLEAREPGRCTVEFTARPAIADGEQTGFSLTIPPVATARLRLHAPAPSNAIAVSSAGAAVAAPDGSRLDVSLGPTSQLRASWPAEFAEPPQVFVEQFLWLNVRPGAVTLDALFEYDVRKGQSKRLSVLVDPSLSPEPDAVVPLVARESFDDVGSLKSLNWDLTDPASGVFRIRRTFTVSGATGVGRLRLPRLETPGAAVVRRWLAISVSPSLEPTLVGIAPLDANATALFRTAWGTTDVRPDMVLALDANDPAWMLQTRTPAPQTHADQLVMIRFERGSAALRFEADLETSRSAEFRHRVVLPPECVVERASLVEAGAERASRWTRDENGRVTVFLTGGVQGKQRLLIEGRLPIPVGEWSLPPMRVLDAEIRSTRVALLRTDSASVIVGEIAGLEPESPQSLPQPARVWGRLAGWYRETTADRTARVAVFPNEPKLSAVQVDSLERDGKIWRARIACRLNVENGQAGVLMFEIPTGWTGPFETSSGAATEIVTIPGAARPRLLVRLDEPVAGAFDFSLSAPWLADGAEAPHMPDARLLDAATTERYWLLPPVEGSTQPWEFSDLEPASLPETLATLRPSIVSPGDSAVFRVAGDHPLARAATLAVDAAAPQVRLAEVHAAIARDASYYGWIGFDVAPRGATTVPLELPDRCRLVWLKVDGMHATPFDETRAQGANLARVSMGGGRLASRVEMLFRGTASRALDGRIDLAAPTLGDLPVERWLWTVASPPAVENLESPGAATLLSPADYELFRLQGLAAAIDPSAEFSADAAPQIAAWYRPWGVRVRASQTAIDGLGPAPAEAERIAADLTAWHRRVSVGPAELTAWSRQAPLAAESEFWKNVQRTAPPERHFTMDGLTGQLQLLSLGAGATLLDRWLAAAGVFGVFAMTARLLRTPEAAAWLREWTGASVVLAGLAWWLWLSPSVVGLPIVVVGIALSLRSGWRRK